MIIHEECLRCTKTCKQPAETRPFAVCADFEAKSLEEVLCGVLDYKVEKPVVIYATPECLVILTEAKAFVDGFNRIWNERNKK